MTGGGVWMTFSSPRQALLLALASRRGRAPSAQPVRIGIYIDEKVAAGADPLADAVNAGLGIAGRAAGGAVMVSDAIRQLVGTAPAVRFDDRGRCR